MEEKRTAEKLRVFLAYDLWKVAAVTLALSFAVFLVWHFFHKEPVPVLYAAVFDVTLSSNETDALKTQLAEALFKDSYAEDGEALSKEALAARITIDDSFRSDNRKDIERLQVLLFNHALELVIADEEVIKTLAGFGYFSDVREFLPKDTAESYRKGGLLWETAGYLDTEEISLADTETGQGEVLPYALRLSESAVWSALSGDSAPDFLAAAVRENAHEAAVRAFLLLLTDEDM